MKTVFFDPKSQKVKSPKVEKSQTRLGKVPEKSKSESQKVKKCLTFLVFVKHPLPGKSHALRRKRHMEGRRGRGACNGQGLTSAPFLPDHPGLQGTNRPFRAPQKIPNLNIT